MEKSKKKVDLAMNEAASAGREESGLATILTSVALGSQREVVIHKEDVLFALSPK